MLELDQRSRVVGLDRKSSSVLPTTVAANTMLVLAKFKCKTNVLSNVSES